MKSEIIPRGNLSDHLANERTFLAWIRTSVGIMAFGFVVVKFTLFIRQLSLILQKPISTPVHGYTSVVGIFLVAFGAIIALLSFFRYRVIDKQLVNSSYRPSTLLSSALAASVIIIGACLVVYLVRSV